MPNHREGVLPSELRRQKRRAAAKMRSALSRMHDAMHILQSVANDISITYEQVEMKRAQKEANKIVNALRTKSVYSVDGLDMMDDVLSKFESLPEELT